MASVRLNKQFAFWILVCQIGIVMMGAPLPKFNAQRCDALKLDECFRDLQVFLRLTSLPYTSDVGELDKLCEQSVAGYNCSLVLHENSDCLSSQNKELLPIFISMAQYTHLMLCGGNDKDKGFLRPVFLEQSECIMKYKNELSCCSRESHITNLPVLQIFEEPSKSVLDKKVSTCCPLSRYLQCVSDSVAECGEDASNFTSQYIRYAAGQQVQELCQTMPNYPNPDNETCTEMVPTCSGCFTLSIENYLCIFVFAILFITHYKHF